MHFIRICNNILISFHEWVIKFPRGYERSSDVTDEWFEQRGLHCVEQVPVLRVHCVLGQEWHGAAVSWKGWFSLSGIVSEPALYASICRCSFVKYLFKSTFASLPCSPHYRYNYCDKPQVFGSFMRAAAWCKRSRLVVQPVCSIGCTTVTRVYPWSNYKQVIKTLIIFVR